MRPSWIWLLPNSTNWQAGAKDMGSAAVFISLALTVILWILALISL